VKLRVLFVVFAIISLASGLPVAAQTNSVIGQFTSSSQESFAGGISGDGRFVVFESKSDLATEDPRNSDGNSEIFIWDFAQRRIFQITDTKAVLKNTFGTATQDNIKIDIVNKRPVISQNGRWIAFASNATASIISPGDLLNPGSFDGNFYNTQTPLPVGAQCPAPTPTPTPTATPSPTPTPTGTPAPTPTPVSTPFYNPLSCDANMEVWLYEIPIPPNADLSSGDEVPLFNLSGGAFTRATNSKPSRFPQDGTTTRAPFIADDNHDASIDDDGSVVAFVSTRDLVPCVGNAFPSDDNDDIFTFVRGGTAICSGTTTSDPGLNQVTRTPRDIITNPVYNKNPTISADGSRVLFASTGDDPIDDPANATNFDSGSNPLASRNEEVFFSDLDPNGAPSALGIKRQVTTTTPVGAGDIINSLEYGKRMSRNGNLIAFDSRADLGGTPPGANHSSFATYLYDATANTFRQIGPRSDADSEAIGGDVPRYPSFTDYDANGAPATLMLETRLNIKPDGTMPTTESDGLNPIDNRPVQIYTYPLDDPPTTAIFSRVTKFPISNTFLAQTQPLTSDFSSRSAFNLGLTELGGGNGDLLSEVYYLYIPAVTAETTETLSFATGASDLPVLPTSSASPTPTPSPSPTATPVPTPTPSPSPTPVTPAAVQGISPGMLAILHYDAGLANIIPRTATGSLTRTFNLPMELSGVSMTINGYACGMKSVSSTSITFVVPPALPTVLTGTFLPVVINNQGTAIKGFVTIVPARPDIFSSTFGPGGRAQATNVTNRVHRTEPFTVTTIKVKGGTRVPTVLRLRITGVAGAAADNFKIRMGNETIQGTTVVLTGGVIVEPGVYTVDFLLPAGLNGDGDVPIIVDVFSGTTTFSSRLDDTAPRIRIL
jgi:uncharacterized protein (TIGR03437 family)